MNLSRETHTPQLGARKAHGVLSQLTRAFHYRDKFVFRQLYIQHVRPILEFCTPAWAPWLIADVEILEKVQKRFVRMVSGLSSSTYGDKLKELKLLSLSDRRAQLDLVQVYKIINKIDDTKI